MVTTWLSQTPASIDGNLRVLLLLPVLLKRFACGMIPTLHGSPTERTPSVELSVPTGMCATPTVKFRALRHLRKKPCVLNCHPSGSLSIPSPKQPEVYSLFPLEASFTFLAMILCVGNVQSNNLSEDLAQTLYPHFSPATDRRTTHRYGYSFWLLLLIILLNIITVVIIFFYQKARYQQKQEQRKPMEYAPRDGILF